MLKRLARLILSIAAGYVAGSIMTADFVAKVANRRRERQVDLRARGSGNPGAMNAIGELGTGYGLAIMAGDIGKGAVGAQAGRLIGGDAGAYAAGAAAVFGHCFPATTGFKGGKGVATSAGATAALFPLYAPVDVFVAVFGYVASKKASVATFSASSLFVVLSVVWWMRRLPNGWGPRPTAGLPMFAVITTSIIAYKFATTPAEGSHIEKRWKHPPASSRAVRRDARALG